MKGERNEKENLEDFFYSEIENPQEELNYLKRSLDLYSKFTYLPNLTARTLLKLGKTYTELDEYQNALESYQIALEIYRDENNPEGQGYAFIGMGKLSEKNSNYADSRRYFTNALEIAQELNNPKMENNVSNFIASSYMEEGYLDDALREYNELDGSLSYNDKMDKHLDDTQVVKLKKQLFMLKPTRSQAGLLLFYLIFLLGSELFTAYNYFEIGILAHVLLIVGLIINSSLTKSTSFSNLLRAMIILPLVRIIGISIPALQIQPIFWYALVSIPLFVAAFILIKNQNLSRKSVGLITGKLPLQFVVALSGIVFGLIEYQILKPGPIISSPSLIILLLASIILLISTGLVEEIIYRGIIQKNAENVLGKFWGLLYASVLFTILYIGWQSSVELIFVFFVAIFYGYIFQRTRSIFGISLSHGITNILLLLIIPVII